MRISDWSSDVCSSDLLWRTGGGHLLSDRSARRQAGEQGASCNAGETPAGGRRSGDHGKSAGGRLSQDSSGPVRSWAGRAGASAPRAHSAAIAEYFLEPPAIAATRWRRVRSEERRVENEGVSTCRYRGA